MYLGWRTRLTIDDSHALDSLVDLLHNVVHKPRQEDLLDFLGERIVEVTLVLKVVEHLESKVVRLLVTPNPLCYSVKYVICQKYRKGLLFLHLES